MAGPVIRRRRLLAALASATGLFTRRALAKGPEDVAVIGGGMAGLAAAGACARAGLAVTIYEARPRIGGRVWTDRAWPGMPVDMGASWIHGTRRNPLTALADQAGLPRAATDYDSAAAFASGTEVPDVPDPWDLMGSAQEAALDAGADLSLARAVARLPGWRALSTADQAALRAAVHRAVEHEYGGDWGDLSARTFDASDDFGGGDVLFPGGYDALAAHAARGLDIRLNAAVTRLTARSDGVEMTFADGARLRAGAVIVTVPLGVLKAGQVAFDPPLAPSRQSAIDGLGMGLLNKCWLRYNSPPPVPAVDWLGNLGASAPVFAEWLNPGPSTGLPLLLGFNAAATADTVESLSDAETEAAATETLRQMFGSRFPAPVASTTSRWRADRLALGSYSFNATGTGPRTRRALAGTDWDDRLAFAGEAASEDHPATVHGAWMSGLDAAFALI